MTPFSLFFKARGCFSLFFCLTTAQYCKFPLPVIEENREVREFYKDAFEELAGYDLTAFSALLKARDGKQYALELDKALKNRHEFLR